MAIEYKPFSKQLRECHVDGTLCVENCPCCGGLINICKKYGKICQSKVCYDERVKEKITCSNCGHEFEKTPDVMDHIGWIWCPKCDYPLENDGTALDAGGYPIKNTGQ